jgi:dipeptidyl aminopeptidase/acylaminoacyl peptidase
MAGVQEAPYGSWRSPITSDLIVAETVPLGSPALDGADIYWLEGRLREGGRQALVRRAADGRISDVVAAPFNVRTRVHEYGGGAYTVHHGTVYFSHFADARLYRVTPGGEPQAITPEGAYRYADLVMDAPRGRLLCVREDHSDPAREARNTLVSVDAAGDAEGGRVLIAGNDFYAAPRLSPDGSRLAWLTWNHPNMPWDGTELWVADIVADGSLGERRLVAGGPRESIFQPEWSAAGDLYFCSDRTGWWNLYREREGRIEPLHPMEAEFGMPMWQFGMSTYAFAGDGSILALYMSGGAMHLGRLDVATGALVPISTPYTSMGSLRVSGEKAVFVAAAPSIPQEVALLDSPTGQLTPLRRSSSAEIATGYISEPRPIEFPTAHGRTAHALYYPPTNQDYTAPPGSKPPLIVEIHGGPTSVSFSGFSPQIQYWTSRGFAIVDVNYGGSTGYGREYRERLYGQWGVVDVEDCANAARYLAEQGLADPARLAIHGGSAGGYTTLAALTFLDTFEAGASHFGVSDLELLARDTHKFESRYLDQLVGPYPAEQATYRERSPIHHADRLRSPVIFFQGLDDRVVPPSQAETMVAALRANGVPVAYLPFEGEGHGFRKAENIKRSLDAELYFYSRVFGFPLPEPIEPVEIDNL